MELISASKTPPREVTAVYLPGWRFVRFTVLALCFLTVLTNAVLLPLFIGSNLAKLLHRENPSDGIAKLTEASAAVAGSPVLQDYPVRILHQSWKTTHLPPRFRRWSESFTRCHPEWRRRLWTNADNENLIAKHYPWFLTTYRSFAIPVQKADLARLFYMHQYGGVYCDLDCECLRPFEHLLANVSLAFAAMEGHAVDSADNRYVAEGQIENGFMYSIPGHPFILRLIQEVLKTMDFFGNPEDTTGPYLLMREIHRLRRSRDGVPASFRGMKYMEIFPPSFFNPFSWLTNKVPACIDKGRFTRAEEARCRAVHSNRSFVLQYHTQVWFAGVHHLNQD